MPDEKGSVPLLHKEDTDWVRDNMLFNYCFGDDIPLLVESFVQNNQLTLHVSLGQFYFCITGVDKSHNQVNTAEAFSKSLHEYRGVMKAMTDRAAELHYAADICLLKNFSKKRTAYIHTKKFFYKE